MLHERASLSLCRIIIIIFGDVFKRKKNLEIRKKLFYEYVYNMYFKKSRTSVKGRNF